MSPNFEVTLLQLEKTFGRSKDAKAFIAELIKGPLDLVKQNYHFGVDLLEKQ